jgi:hypothetical protein
MKGRETKEGEGGNLGAGTPAGRLDADSRVADVIAADPAVVDRLAALHPTFRRLREQEGRETVGRMATLRDAAQIAAVPVAVLLAVVNGEIPAPCAAGSWDDEQEPRPAWMDRFDEAAAQRIEVRPILADGHDPFFEIMAVVDTVPVAGGLTIDAPFNPVPLRRVLGRKGFVSYAQRIAAHHWRLFLLHDASAETEQPPPVTTDTGAKVWRTEDGVHIDVRGLERPVPMIAILSLIDGSGHEGVVVAHLDREPVFLYPELAERGWSHALVPGEPGEVRLVLSKDDG